MAAFLPLVCSPLHFFALCIVDNISGDIASYPQPGTGEQRRIEHWNVRQIWSWTPPNRETHCSLQVAGNHGRAVGKTIAEGKGQPFVKVPVFWSARTCYVDVYMS